MERTVSGKKTRNIGHRPVTYLFVELCDFFQRHANTRWDRAGKRSIREVLRRTCFQNKQGANRIARGNFITGSREISSGSREKTPRDTVSGYAILSTIPWNFSRDARNPVEKFHGTARGKKQRTVPFHHPCGSCTHSQ